MSKEDKDDLELLKATRNEDSIPFDEYMKKKINIRKSDIKDQRKIDHKNKEKIHSGILELKNFEPTYRLRVEDYKILFDVSENTIEIGRVLHRKGSYN